MNLATFPRIRLGLQCHILLEGRTGFTRAAHKRSGNVVLDKVVGTSLVDVPGDEAADRSVNTPLALARATVRQWQALQGAA